MLPTKIIVALSALSCVLAAPADVHALTSRQNSPCAALVGNGTAYQPSQVRACLQSVPFREDVRQNIMSAVTAIYSLDIFEYNQLGTNDGALTQNVNIQQQFGRINSTKYNSDYEFQADLTNVLNSLNDGHHYWQSCYTPAFQTVLPFSIIAASVDNSSSTKIYLPPDLALFVESKGLTSTFRQAGVNVSALAGAEVTKINQRDVWDYLWNNEVPRVGQYQDPQQRLNYLFARYSTQQGRFVRNPGAFASTLDLSRNNITFGLKLTNGTIKDQTVPWVSIWQGNTPFNYTSGEAFFQAVCLPKSSTTASTASASSISAPATGTTTGAAGQSTATASASPSMNQSLAELAAGLYRACPLHADTSLSSLGAYSPINRTNAYLGGRDVQFFVLPQNKTGVIVIPTFGPSPQSDACYNRFVLDLIYGFQNFSRVGVENVLIDTSNNGGGSVALNQAAQRLFTGQQFLEESNFQSVLRRGPLAEALYKVSVNSRTNTTNWSPQKYRNGTQLLPNGTQIFQPGLQRSVNGYTLYTSTYLEDPISQIQMVDMAFNVSDAAPYPPKKLVFTGNGLCGSACSSFTNFLIEYYNATAYIASGQPDQPIEFQAFAAGQAVTSPDIYDDAASVAFNDTKLLPQLGVVGTLGIALRASISPRIAPGKFIQYRPFPAQNRFAVTPETYLDPYKQWQYVASKVFP